MKIRSNGFLHPKETIIGLPWRAPIELAEISNANVIITPGTQPDGLHRYRTAGFNECTEWAITLWAPVKSRKSRFLRSSFDGRRKQLICGAGSYVKLNRMAPIATRYKEAK